MPILALVQKELSEQWRTRRLLVLGAVFLFFGLLGPITAKMMPELFKMLDTSGQGIVINIPTPTAVDALGQYVKNLAQILPLVVLLVSMGSMAGEKERGTLHMVLAKPVSRGMLVASKFAGLALGVAVAFVLGALATYYYTVVLFGSLKMDVFLTINLAAGLYLLFVLAITFLASTVMRSTVAAGATAFGLWMLFVILGSIPKVGLVSPVKLMDWAGAAMVGKALDGQGVILWASIAWTVVALGAAWFSFRKQEL